MAIVVTLAATYVDGSDTPVNAGHVTFQLSSESQISASDLMVGAVPVRCGINSLGQLIGPQGQVGCPLIANDNTTINPVGTDYVVTEVLPGGITNQYTITIDSSMAPTVDLSSLTLSPVPPPNP